MTGESEEQSPEPPKKRPVNLYDIGGDWLTSMPLALGEAPDAIVLTGPGLRVFRRKETDTYREVTALEVRGPG